MADPYGVVTVNVAAPFVPVGVLMTIEFSLEETIVAAVVPNEILESNR